MNIKEQLLVEISRKNTDFIAHYIGNNPNLFKEVLDLIFSGKPPLPLRAAWVVTAVTDKHPELLKPYLKKIISNLKKFEHPGTRRNLLRYISYNEIPKNMEGILYDTCYQYVLSKDEPPAVKVYSMQIMYNIALKEPELLREVKLIVEGYLDHDSAAIKSRSRHLTALLNKKPIL